ncbi:hypothetical protein BJX99DRAFT_232870 [Aspergillus californicus]
MLVGIASALVVVASVKTDVLVWRGQRSQKRSQSVENSAAGPGVTAQNTGATQIKSIAQCRPRSWESLGQDASQLRDQGLQDKLCASHQQQD